MIAGGTATLVPGSISTDGITLQSASWKAQAISPASAPARVLSNAACGNVQRNDFAPSVGGGRSDWKCDLVVSTAAGFTQDATYNLTLTGIDTRNQVHSVSRSLRVLANPTYDPARYANAAGPAFAVQPGQLGTLRCNAENARSYQWVIASNGGTNVRLSQAFGSEAYFTAPVVPVATPLTFECRVAVDQRIFTSRVTATVAAATTNTLVVSASGPQFIPLGTSTYSAEAIWLSPSGQPASGETPVVSFDLASALPAGITVATAGPAASVTVGTGTVAPLVLPLRATATAGGQASVARLGVVVEPAPSGSIGPVAVSPGAQTVQPGATVNITATGGEVFEWAVVSGPAVLLGGASSSTVQFIAPSVTTPTDIVLRVAVGYRALSATNPAVQFADAVVKVSP